MEGAIKKGVTGYKLFGGENQEWAFIREYRKINMERGGRKVK